MKKILILSIVSLFYYTAHAGPYIKAGVGYGMGNQKYLLEQITTSSGTENIYASFGGNAGIQLGAGFTLNDHSEFGIDLVYQHGRSAVSPGMFFNKTYTGRLISLNPHFTLKTDISRAFIPYAKFGLMTGLPLMNMDVNGDLKKFRGGIPLGPTAALGFDYDIDELKFYVEIYSQSMLYKPTKRIESNGGKVVFTDQLSNSAPLTTELHHHFFSYGALGITIGLKFVL